MDGYKNHTVHVYLYSKRNEIYRLGRYTRMFEPGTRFKTKKKKTNNIDYVWPLFE